VVPRLRRRCGFNALNPTAASDGTSAVGRSLGSCIAFALLFGDGPSMARRAGTELMRIKTLGLTVPPSILARADEVIE